MCAQAAPQQSKPGKKKGGAVQLNFTELDDLFLNTKGKALRNIRKKMEKYRELEKQVRKGEIQANAQQKQQIESIPSLKAEIDELDAVCKLYMESNPNYDKKASVQPAVSEADIAKAVTETLMLVGKASQLTLLMQEDSSFVECNEGRRASMMDVYRKYKLMNENADKGSEGFTNVDMIEDFVTAYTKLAMGSHDIVKGSCSYHELAGFINASFSDNDQIQQRIADSKLQKKREQEAAAAEAARKEAEKQAEEEERAAAAIGDALDDFDVFDDDYGAEAAPAKVDPPKPAAPKQEEKPAEKPKEAAAPVEEDKNDQSKAEPTENQGEGGDAAATQDGNRGGRGGRGGRRDNQWRDRGDNSNWRGGDRDGNWRGGDRGDHRGNRGGRGGDRGYNRGGRGGYRKSNEDEDGFVMETGEKPKPRNRGNYRGRGNRGDRGEFRGGNRGDRDGNRGDRDGHRGGRGGRGGRPQTSDGGDNGAAGQEQQPAAREIGAQASTNGQGQV